MHDRYALAAMGLLVVAMVIVAAVAACNDAASYNSLKKREAQLLTGETYYAKDSRTQLCFAYLRVASAYPSLTHVPCTPEVEQLIREQK